VRVEGFNFERRVSVCDSKMRPPPVIVPIYIPQKQVNLSGTFLVPQEDFGRNAASLHQDLL
jgi:hypothetical protein